MLSVSSLSKACNRLWSYVEYDLPLLAGKTALHWAAAVNSLNVTKELLRSGAKKDQQDDKVRCA